jgi:hypothetical protein
MYRSRIWKNLLSVTTYFGYDLEILLLLKEFDRLLSDLR